MKDIENLLKKAPLSEPSQDLNQRVEDSVNRAERGHAVRRRAAVPLWAFAAGCLACTLIGFLIHPLVQRPQPPPAEGASVVYIVEPTRSGLRILGTKPKKEKKSFWQEKRGELKPLMTEEKK